MIKKIAANGLVYIGFEVINKSIPFLLIPILSNYLGAQEIGKFAQFTAIMGILAVFIGLSTHGAISVSFFTEDKRTFPKYVFNVLIILCGSAFATFLISFFLSRYIFDWIPLPENWISLAVIACMGQYITQINLVIWQCEKKPFQYGVYQFIISLCYFAVTLYLVFFIHRSWEAAASAMVIVYSFFGLISCVTLYRRKLIEPVFSRDHVIDALKFGVPLMPHVLAGWFFLGFNILLIEQKIGTAASGVMNIAMQFSMIVNVVALAVNRAYSPFVYELIEGAREGSRELLVKLTYLGFLVMAALGISIGIGSYIVLNYFISSEFKEALNIIGILVAGSTFGAMYFLVAVFVFYHKKTAQLSMITFTAAILHVILSILLIDKYGLMGVSISLLVVSVLKFFATWILAMRTYELPWVRTYYASE